MIENGFLDLMQEEHLDTLIHLAFEMDAARIIERLEKETEKTFSQREEQITQRAITSAYEKLRQQELNERKNRQADRHHRRMMRAIEILACVVLAIGISAPVAVASIETLRQRIVEFLISMNPEAERAEVDPYEDLVIPDDWEGEYYPTFLPEGIYSREIDPFKRTKMLFSAENNVTIVFSENDDDSFTAIGTENELMSIIDINGHEARLWEFFEERYYCRIIWDVGERWFMLETKNLDRDVAYLIAESVRKISD